MNRRIIQLNLLLRRNGYARAAYLKKVGYFHQQGSGCFLQPWNFGTEPYLISLGDNVYIASNVKFVTHDVIALMLRSKLDCKEINERMGTISIGSNVFVGSDTTILYDVSIGDNVIVAAGSLVTKSLPSGTVCAGRPGPGLRPFAEPGISRGRALGTPTGPFCPPNPRTPCRIPARSFVPGGKKAGAD